MRVEELDFLRRRVAELEAERQKLLARLAYLEARARDLPKGGVLSREKAEELHGLLSAVWLELNELHPARVEDLDRALRLLEDALR
ncbi:MULTISPECIES: hypothetical protein [Thermus]|uniref:Uncharacterized protein n=2 Tax=Thermus TaxID=270 RepID=A0A430RYD6_THESC|nr:MULTISPECIES: hypothetical protein [Thermus]RTH26047.1 hypothetical protein CSW38_06710 [Thermus scotoductus]BDG17770.1 hypothetical protein TbrSNM41_25040 [Thermus brockianus]